MEIIKELNNYLNIYKGNNDYHIELFLYDKNRRGKIIIDGNFEDLIKDERFVKDFENVIVKILKEQIGSKDEIAADYDSGKIVIYFDY